MEENEKKIRDGSVTHLLTDKVLMFAPVFNNEAVEKRSNRLPSSVEKKKNVISRSTTDSYIKHDIGKGVTVLLVENKDEDFTKLKTLEDLINLDKRNPNIVAGFIPPLFHEYIDKTTNTINSKIKIGDVVSVKPKYKESGGEQPKRVQDIYLKALNNMTVIIAVMGDNDLRLYNRLQIWK